MKKILLLFGSFALLGASYAQQRFILAESFSQASCGPCASQNPAFKALIDANASKIVAIKYQTSWPGVDPMNAQNATEIGNRVSYYGISGVPDRIMDGTNMTVTQGAIDSRYAVASPVSMTISHSFDPGYATVDVTVTITAPNVWNPSNTVLQLAMVEREITFESAPGSNGETEFHDVMRKMVPNTSGTPVVASNFSSANGTQTFTFNDVPVPSYIYKITELGFIAWVQDNTTKEVHQAGVSEPLLLPDFAEISDLNASDFSCAADLSGAVAVLSNVGNNVITSATVNYKIDAGTVQTAPFSGSIAVGGTANFNIPTTAVTSGSHTLTTYLTNINGSGSTTPMGTTTTTFSRISAAGTTGNFSQDFASSAFPYANYSVYSATDKNWARVAANTGSAKYDNYNVAAGNKGNMILAPVDLSSISNKTMTFDVAYRQYASENDKLEVFVSTDCGSTWTSVYAKQGSTLSTGAATTSAFTPTAASDWRNESVSLTPYGTANKLFVKFEATSAYGNNLYVDKINIGGGTASINEASAEIAMSVYPNPASEIVNVSFEGTGADYSISILDVSGRTVATQVVTASGATTVEMPINNLQAGNYFVSVANGTSTYTQKLMVK
ncbi:MAG: hypothetical protein K0S23_2275 [Fluviicola sp.]|jgi:hypothetical protein|uniref:T9SS type A sorting domain-containing protein n=1 Tax=Fluviicola sp. TaxID=1917219 RepID=UPI0026321BA2|nr:T9SS type A sorting domain-containing protein [Fluviicola sp.]MDF3027968.1 hypothetical protein [Fluviicola sp.]